MSLETVCDTPNSSSEHTFPLLFSVLYTRDKFTSIDFIFHFIPAATCTAITQYGVVIFEYSFNLFLQSILTEN